MALKIESCSLNEWAEKAKRISGYQGSVETFLRANNFSVMQFLDDDSERRKNHRAFRLLQDDIAVAWVSIYSISPTVMRLRGLYVLETYRRRGLMTQLLRYVLQNETTGAQSVISFSLPHSIDFHRKNGFGVEERFIPRPAEDRIDGEHLTLMIYKFTARSFKS